MPVTRRFILEVAWWLASTMIYAFGDSMIILPWRASAAEKKRELFELANTQ